MVLKFKLATWMQSMLVIHGRFGRSGDLCTCSGDSFIFFVRPLLVLPEIAGDLHEEFGSGLLILIH